MNKHLFLMRIALVTMLFLGLAIFHLTWPTHGVTAAGLSVADGEAIYVVQRGDTLSAIARRYGTSVSALMTYNGLTSTTIYVGQRLLLPGANTPGNGVTHVVQRGETLYRIAQQYGSSITAIKAANHLQSDTIYVGQRLLIPGAGGVPGGVERIQFAPGAISATVNSFAIANAPKRYLLRAMAGQEMTVNMVTPSAFTYITVLTPAGGNLAAADGIIQNWTGTLPTTGDYTVEVINTAQGAANFALQVTIVTPSSGPINEAGEAVLEQLTVQTVASSPVQMQAVIRGQLPDACSYIVNARQQREDNTFRLRLTTARYANRRCAQVLTPFEQVVLLDTYGLPAGTYSVRINQISTAFTLAAGNLPNTTAQPTNVQAVMAQADIAIHAAPQPDAPVIGNVAGGMIAQVTGVSADGQWWRVVCPDGTGSSCWVLADPGSTQPTSSS